MHQVTDHSSILENYGIGSTTDVSQLEKGDFSELETLGLKPFQLMRLLRWCEEGGVTEMLPSSSTVPRPPLTSSVDSELTVSDGVDNEKVVTESQSDDSVSNESGDRESDKDCV